LQTITPVYAGFGQKRKLIHGIHVEYKMTMLFYIISDGQNG